MRYLLPLFLAATLLFSNGISASHATGAKITYVQVNSNTYLVSLAILRDCDGITLTNTAPLDVTGPCGTFTQTLPLSYSVFTTNSCDPIGQPSTCSGGTLPGYELVVYQDTVTLQTGPTCDWTLSWDLCCRNSTIINLTAPTTNDLYVQTEIKAGTYGINSSPEFLDATIPVFCVNTAVTRDPVVVDLEGDSLYFELYEAFDMATIPVGYQTGYSGLQPIPGISINNATGAVTFNAAMIGNYVIVTRVSEYRNGQYMGSVNFDRQFIIANCTNSSPFPTSNGMSNFSGNAVQTSPFSIAMCEGQNFCFDLSFDDPDAGQVLSLQSDVSTLPGATFTQSGTGPYTATVCWTAPPGAAGVYPIIVNAGDGVCPLQGSSSLAVIVNVTPGTFAGPDVTICNSQGSTIGVFGFPPYQWSVLSGDPIVVGTNFSCDTCVNPIANPATTTTYLLTSSAPVGCVLTDTVTVNVVPNLTIINSPSDTVICVNQGIQLNAVAQPFDPSFTYSWSPTTGLNDPTIPNPQLFSNQSGLTAYTVTVSNATGCAVSDTVMVNITQSPITVGLGPDSIGVAAPPFAMSGVPAGGTYFGAGVSGNIFDPAAAGVGTYVITYQGAGSCSGSALDTIVVYQDVGISEYQNSNTLSIVPNPAKNFFMLSNTMSFETLELIDAQGRTVRVWNALQREYSIQDIRSGAYFVRMRTEIGERQGRIVIE